MSYQPGATRRVSDNPTPRAPSARFIGLSKDEAGRWPAFRFSPGTRGDAPGWYEARRWRSISVTGRDLPRLAFDLRSRCVAHPESGSPLVLPISRERTQRSQRKKSSFRVLGKNAKGVVSYQPGATPRVSDNPTPRAPSARFMGLSQR